MIKTEKMQNIKSDEKYLETRFGKQLHFKTPEGFLDGLADSIMNNVEQQKAGGIIHAAAPHPTNTGKAHEPHNWWARYRRYVAAAACVAFIGIGATAYFAAGTKEPHDSYAASAKQHTEAAPTYTYDEIADYTMLDNDDIYSLLASN